MTMASARKATINWPEVAAELLDAGLEGNRRAMEAIAMRLIRQCRQGEPDAAAQIGKVLSVKMSNASAVRFNHIQPAPLDSDSSLSLLRVESFDKDCFAPIFDAEIHHQVEKFVIERQHAERLFAAGLKPPSTILLAGPPGTGKTMLAKWLAKALEIRMATFDLATAISSFLGRTGMNLRRSLDYARSSPTLLLLDEFDSIAKRRGDAAEVGELNRVVNTLLKELEDWPTHSVLVAATNHETLLDPAIFRRFDLVIHVPLPSQTQRAAIFERSLGEGRDAPQNLLNIIAILTEGLSAADIERLALSTLRKHILEGTSLQNAIHGLFPTLAAKYPNSKMRGELVASIREEVGKSIPMRTIGEWFDLSESTVHHHINKNKKK